MKNKNVICIIPARGGSVRLPRKNVKLFCSIPLIGWSIIQAKTCKYVSKTVVVTDDDEIADISKSYGAEVIMQPEWMKNKMPHGGMAVTYALSEENKLQKVDTMLSMMCTNPLVKPGQLDEAFELYYKLGVDSLQPLQPMREIVLSRKIDENKAHTFILSKHYEYLREGGNWGITNAQKLLDSKVYDENYEWTDPTMDEFIPSDCNYFPVECWQYADTDTLPEFEMAEVLMEGFILKGRGREVYTEYGKEVKQLDLISKYAGNSKQLGGE